MPLDPQVAALLEVISFGDPPDMDAVSPQALRELAKAMPGAGSAGVAVHRVENRRIAGPAQQIPIRIFTPGQATRYPILMYFHGGGFVICDLDTHDATCRELANAAQCIVISVGYRLAPEAKFPAGLQDCYAATCWALANAAELGADPGRIAVAGDSAGGNLAAAVALMARDRGEPSLAHQLLIYPVIDCNFDTPSYLDNAEGYLLTRAMMQWFWGHYLADPGDAANPLASPIRAESLAGLPPATIITAEYDPLRDEGEGYADRLLDAGVATTLLRYDGMIHGFFAMPDQVDRARNAIDRAAAALRSAFR